VSEWAWLWTGTWFVGLALFSALSVAVTIWGARDVVSLFRSLARGRTDGSASGTDKTGG